MNTVMEKMSFHYRRNANVIHKQHREPAHNMRLTIMRMLCDYYYMFDGMADVDIDASALTKFHQ